MSRPNPIQDLIDEMERATAKFGTQVDLPTGTGPYTFIGPTMWNAKNFELATKDATNAALAQRPARFGREPLTWAMIITEEFAEAHAEADPVKLRTELIQLAGVAMRAVYALDAQADR
jgi:hypothetical protein